MRKQLNIARGGSPPTEEAFMAMVKRNEALIYKVCLAFTRQRREEVQDLKQEVLCNLWRGFDSFKKESRETTWIYKVALNTALQYYRKLQRTPQFEELTPRMADICVDEDDQQQLARMYELIHRLDDEEQKLIYLYLDDVSGKETAKILGMTPGNVRIKLFRIKEKLKTMAQDEKD